MPAGRPGSWQLVAGVYTRVYTGVYTRALAAPQDVNSSKLAAAPAQQSHADWLGVLAESESELSGHCARWEGQATMLRSSPCLDRVPQQSGANLAAHTHTASSATSGLALAANRQSRRGEAMLCRADW